VARSRSELVGAIELAVRQHRSAEVAQKPMPPRRPAFAGPRW
jgi:hypothetical protein